MNRVNRAGLAVLLAVGAGCGGAPGQGPATTAAPDLPPGPVASAPLELSAVMRAVHFSYRAANGGFEGGHDGYSVAVDEAGTVAFTPAVPSGGAAPARTGAAARIETAAVARGAARLDLAPELPAVDRDGSLWTARGPVLEHLQNGDAGVEQSWLFPWQPEGQGDVTVRVRVSGLDYAGETASGHHFTDPVSGLGVRYGKATWVDRLGVATELAAHLEGSELVLTVPAAVVDGSVFPAVLDPIIGAELQLDVPVASSWAPAEPAVATGGGINLAVWADGTRGGVWAARLDASGAVLDPAGLQVATGAGVRSPALAFGTVSAQAQFLVAWSTGAGVSYRRVQATSAGVTWLDPAPVAISSTATDDLPSAGFDAGGSKFLVAWQRGAAGSTSAMGWLYPTPATVLTLAASGAGPRVAGGLSSRFLVAWSTASGARAGRFNSSNGSLQNGTVLTVSTSSGEVDALSNGSEWLVVGSTSARTRLWGRRISSGGALAGSAALNLTNVTAAQQLSPSAGWNGTEYVLAWVEDTATPALRFQHVSRSGNVTTSNNTSLVARNLDGWVVATAGMTPAPHLAISRSGTSADVVLGWSSGARVWRVLVPVRPASGAPAVAAATAISQPPTAAQTVPAVAFNGTRYLVVWQDARSAVSKDIYGVQVSSAGALVPPVITVASATADESAPAVASDGVDFLVAWSDGAVKGATVTAASGAVSAPLTLSASATGQVAPRVAYSGGSYLAVWTDTAGSGQPNVLGQRVAAGALQGGAISVSATTAAEQSPDVAAAPSGGWIVAWQHATTDVRDAQIASSGAVSSPAVLASGGAAARANPAIDCGPAACLVAWTEGATGSLGVKGVRTSSGGALADVPALSLGTGTGDPQRASVAWDGRDFAVAFETSPAGAAQVWGNRVPASGAPLDGATGAVLEPSGASPRLGSDRSGRALLAFTRPHAPTGQDSVWAVPLGYHNAITVVRAGAGTGTVSSSPAGIACGGTCSAGFDAGAQVTLTATPDAHMTFAGWSGGGCAGSGTCVLTPTAAVTVTAQFDRIERVLTVSKTGTGSGTVNGAGISCGSTCSQAYLEGTGVTLAATPTAGSTFVGWSGAGCSGSGGCTVTMDAAQSVTAQFDLVTHPVTTGATGSGSVALSPAGAAGSCGASCTSYLAGTTLTLTASPAAGWQLSSWSGDCAGQGEICSLFVDAPKSATATFTLIPPVTHTLSVTRTGSGTVTSGDVPPTVDCGLTCSPSVVHGTALTLSAAPAPGWSFSGWGGACAGTGPCTVTVNADTDVSATFVELPPPTAALGVSFDGDGQGRVVSSPAGIDCTGTPCTHDFLIDTPVLLTASPAAPPAGGGAYAFGGWSGGGCSGTGTCLVTMTAALDVTATFSFVPPTLRTLTVQSPVGGTVADDLAQVACGADCVGTYLDGTLVTLVASPAAGATFAGWSGGGCSGTAPCSVVMDAAKTVAARFTYPVTVARAGAGTGTVTSTPAGISCGASCVADLDAGASVTLGAVAAGGSIFAGWSGAGCAGNGPCVFPVLGPTTVTATFDVPPPQYWKLTVGTLGAGAGSVAASPAGAACQPAVAGCASSPAGTPVALTAAPSGGSVFAGWTGACSGTDPQCTVTLSGDATAAAIFDVAPPSSYALTVSRSGSGAGTVTSDVGGIDCGVACGASLAPGTVVTLAATPAAGSVFAGWSGACTGIGGCQVTMSTARSVGAVFASSGTGGPGSWPLATAVGGPGRGTVTATDATLGLACAGQALCVVDVARRSPPTLVTLRALAESDSRFAGWVDACSGTGDCVLPMERSQLARAVFVPRLAQLSVSITGKGRVVASPAGALTCGSSGCAGSFATDAAPVQLTAQADPGWSFDGWVAQECAGTGPCTVTPDRDRALAARFVPSAHTLTVLAVGGGAGSHVSGALDGVPFDCAEASPCTLSVPSASRPPQLTLTAYPDADSDLLGWSGCAPSGETCTVTVAAPTLVIATFGPKTFNATVQLVGPGNGTVTSGAFTCTGGYASCTWQVPKGVVDFEAAAAPGSFFYGWGGVCARTSDPTCTVDFQGSGIVQAVFEPNTFPLQIGIDGPGEVSVVVGAATHPCPGTGCTLDVDNTVDPEHQQVTLTAIPAPGATFWGWSDGCQGSSPTCTITMTGAQWATAHFLPAP